MRYRSIDELPAFMRGLPLEDANAWAERYEAAVKGGAAPADARKTAWAGLTKLRKGRVRFMLLRKAVDPKKPRKAGPTQKVHVGPHMAHNPGGVGLHLVSAHESTRPKAVEEPKKPRVAKEKGEPAKGPEVTSGGANTMVWIRYDRLAAFRDEIAALAKKATRLGLTPPMIRETGATRREHLLVETTSGGQIDGGWTELHEIEIANPTFKMPGWALHAKAEPRGPKDSMVHVMRGAEDVSIPKKYGVGATHCDHCGLARKRKSLFLLKKPGKSGPTAWKQVGGECVKDFTGQDAALLEGAMGLSGALDALLREELGEGAGGAGPPRVIPAKLLLTVAWDSIKASGYRKAEFNDSTRNDVSTVLDAIRKKRAKLDTGPNGEYEKAAEAVLAWVKTIPKGRPEDFMEKLRVTFADPDGVNPRDLGIAVYAVEAYKRAQGDVVERQKAAKLAEGAAPFVGKPGDKIGGVQTAAEQKAGVDRLDPIPVTLKVAASKPNAFGGTTTRFELIDDSGRKIVWFASATDTVTGPAGPGGSQFQYDASDGHREHVVHHSVPYQETATPGRRYLLASGRIKEHSEFNGAKRTMITHAELLPMPSDAELRDHHEQHGVAWLSRPRDLPYNEWLAFDAKHGTTDADHAVSAERWIKYHQTEMARLSAPAVRRADKPPKAEKLRKALRAVLRVGRAA